MCVLIEGINVVVLREALERSYPGGVIGYRENCPNSTFCADDNLTRMGFMNPNDVRDWVNRLEAQGLVCFRDGQFDEVAIVDQRQGPTAPCNWLDFGNQPVDDEPGGDQSASYVVAWLRGTEPTFIEVPEGWTFENSLSKRHAFVPTESINKDQKYLGREGNRDVHIDAEGNKQYVGRTVSDEDESPSA